MCATYVSVTIKFKSILIKLLDDEETMIWHSLGPVFVKSQSLTKTTLKVFWRFLNNII